MRSTLSAEDNKRRDEICYYRAFITLSTRTRNGTFDDDSFGSFVLDNKNPRNIIDGRTNTRSKIFSCFYILECTLTYRARRRCSKRDRMMEAVEVTE